MDPLAVAVALGTRATMLRCHFHAPLARWQTAEIKIAKFLSHVKWDSNWDVEIVALRLYFYFNKAFSLYNVDI